VKPSNLLLAAHTSIIKVLDLGIACLVGESVLAAGTPDYVAPEQVFDPGTADTRSDVYALGCTLYHLLTGCSPFSGGSREEKLRRHRSEEPRGVEELRPELPGALGSVVRKMMKKSPGERFRGPAAVARALAPFAEPGDCASHFVLELDERGLKDLDPGQATAVLSPCQPG
jgi:serine/threonine protein kinase